MRRWGTTALIFPVTFSSILLQLAIGAFFTLSLALFYFVLGGIFFESVPFLGGLFWSMCLLSPVVYPLLLWHGYRQANKVSNGHVASLVSAKVADAETYGIKNLTPALAYSLGGLGFIWYRKLKLTDGHLNDIANVNNSPVTTGHSPSLRANRIQTGIRAGGHRLLGLAQKAATSASALRTSATRTPQIANVAPTLPVPSASSVPVVGTTFRDESMMKIRQLEGRLGFG